MGLFYRIFIPALLLFLSSCSWLDKPEKIPAYIYIEKINLTTNYTAEGTNSHDITDAWVYVDDNPVGVFELPAMIPVLKEGTHKLSIYPGIKADGISSRRRKYPFYLPYIISSHVFVPGEVDTLNGADQPVVTYYPNTQIDIWKTGDFEDPGVVFQQDALSDTVMNRITSPPADIFEGVASGLFALSASQTFFKANTSENFQLPATGQSVYMELNYKAANSFTVGLISEYATTTVQQNNTVVRPSYVDGQLVWKKIYIELTELVVANSNAQSFEVFFSMLKDDGVTEPFVVIDNVKIVYGK
ncbi:MAG: hypothetical protein ACOZCO_05000 [Bacteroidota bacterium]